MAHVVDIEEPWIKRGDVSTYNAEGLAHMNGESLGGWLDRFRQKTAEKGGTILYEGDPEERPASLVERFAADRQERSLG